MYSTEIPAHYQSERDSNALTIKNGDICSILINSEDVEKCLKSNPLEAMRRIAADIDMSKQIFDFNWEIVSYGMKTPINIEVKNNIVIGCEIENPIIFSRFFPFLSKSDIEQYIDNPEKSLNLFYEKLHTDFKQDVCLDPLRYIAIHTPEREIKLTSAKAECFDGYEVVYLDSVKLLRHWIKQANLYKQEKSLSTKIAEKLGLIENKRPHSLSRQDAEIFCQKNDLHTTYFMPNELAHGANLSEGNVGVINGRHRIANAIYSGAPFVPVTAHKSAVEELANCLGWQ